MMRRLASVFVIVTFLISMAILPGTPTQTAQAAQGPQIPRMHQFQLGRPTFRTMDDMLADQATHGRPRAPGAQRAPFRPGIDPAAYAAAKAAAAAAPQVPRSTVLAAASAAPRVAQVVLVNCDGEDQTQATSLGVEFIPPDPDGAFGFSPRAGTLEFVQTTNAHITVWNMERAAVTGCSTAKLFDVDLNSFFGYFNTFITFGTRVVHDDASRRWIISALAVPESPDVQFEFIAVSISDDARGPYFMYSFNIPDITCFNCFWSTVSPPQLGIDSQAVLLTANVFNGSFGFVNSTWLFLNKEALEGGIGLTGCVSGSNLPSWAPPKVVDLNPLTWFVEAQPFALPAGGTTLQLAAIASTGSICPSILSTPAVIVPAYAIPPSAPQPGTTLVLDTGDARFQNRSTQVGNVLWQVHTSGLPFPSKASPRLYRIVVPPPAVGAPTAQSTMFFASLTSQDFNATIAANQNNTITVNWSSTDPPAGINAQVRVGACTGLFGGICSPGRGVSLFPSNTPFTFTFGGNLLFWGRYSAAAIDQSGSFVGGVNEEINNPDDPTGNTWGTRFYIVTNP